MSLLPKRSAGFHFQDPVGNGAGHHVRRTIPSRCRGGKQEHADHSNHNKQELLLHWRVLLLSRCYFD